MKQSFYKINLLPFQGLLGGFLLWLFPLWLSAQTAGKNYIVTTVPFQAVTDPTILADANSNTAIQYFDGLGRPIQTVQRGITPSGADLVTGVMYDSFGRDSLKWLPAAVAGGNNGAYYPNFAAQAVSSNGDAKPYSRTEYEPSPLNRVTGQYGVGNDWYTAGKKQSIEYLANDANIACYYVNSDKHLAKDANYVAGSLYVTKVTDEDGKTGYEFKDKLGRVILKRQMLNGDNVDTYYVYNDLGQLCYVLPPKSVDELTSDLDDNNEILKQYCYLYRYDPRGNCIYKRLPGCEPIYMVYDKTNRLLLSQDGNQRPYGKWTINKYDVLGRVIYIAVVIDAETTYEEELERFRDATVIEWYTQNTENPMGDTGYSTGWYYATSQRLLTVNYYDDYSFLDRIPNQKASLSYDASKEQEGYTAQYTNAKGLLTGTRVYHLDDSTKYEATAIYYDKYGRVVQTRATNHLGGYDLVYNQLDFTGKPTRILKNHNIAGQASVTELYTYKYDKAQRMLTTTLNLNGGDSVKLVTNTYDDLGRLASKNLGGTDTTTYTYNVRSWTKDITGSRFSENLYYNANTVDLPNFTPVYNGNIAGMQWGVANESGNRAYSFTYDGLNRLTDASYTGFSGGVINGTQDKYNEHFGFDKMGNFTALTRYENGSLLNNLSFTYTGNQLKKVDNSISPYIPYGSEAFNDKQKIDTEYYYDPNGSTTADVNTGISTIQYNLLNLPDQIQFTEGHKNMYTYDAAGKKLEAVNYTVHNIVNVPINTISTLPANPSDYTKLTTDYVGNMIYENGSLKQILLPEGYWQNGVFYYYLKDHLGDTRVVINSSGAIIEKSHYYPSGMRFADTSTSNSSALPFRYNGKEMETMNGLNQMDYGARRRYSGLPIWTGRDMLSEKYYSISPYVYCNNNPVNAVDPDGKKILFVNGHWEAGLVGSVMGSSSSGKSYWSAGFTEAAKKFFKDESKITASNYIDGSSEWGGDQSGSDRYSLGYNYAKNNYKSLVKGMKKGETFKLVTHSEGSAYGAGIAEYLIKKGMTVETVVHLSADEGDEFTTPNSPKTYQLGYNGDWVTGNKEISGTDMFGIVDKFSGGMDKFRFSHGSTKDPSIFNEVNTLLNMAIQGASAVNVTQTASGTTFTIVRDNNQKVDGTTGAR